MAVDNYSIAVIGYFLAALVVGEAGTVEDLDLAALFIFWPGLIAVWAGWSSSNGRSLGKLISRSKLVMSDDVNRFPSFWRAFGRYMFAYYLGIFGIWWVFGDERRTLWDRISKTTVLRIENATNAHGQVTSQAVPLPRSGPDVVDLRIDRSPTPPAVGRRPSSGGSRPPRQTKDQRTPGPPKLRRRKSGRPGPPKINP